MSRLFVAILVPPDVAADLDEYVDPVRALFPELRWVPSSRWHVTLEFLGECGRHEAERQRIRWATRARRSPPLELSIACGGAFPHSWKARVLWAGLAVDSHRWRKLAAYGQQPHVTVARTRQARDLTGLVESLSTYSGPSWRVEQIALVESHLRTGGERGPRYEPLEMFSLGS
ncbi:MAG: RNA 2',3'-cyclic phosphodiesterase [Propionibacteriales bacterium]|nr:RNA 2',3'-cyclic phosphodiesterase [Propionibacteriales bacterium]